MTPQPTLIGGPLTPREHDRIAEMAERGLHAGQIAHRLNRQPGTINFAMHALGLKAPIAREFDYVRNGKRVKSFSTEEDAFITALRLQDYSLAKIAQIAGRRFGYERTTATIGIRLKMLANLAEASTAHSQVDAA